MQELNSALLLGIGLLVPLNWLTPRRIRPLLWTAATALFLLWLAPASAAALALVSLASLLALRSDGRIGPALVLTALALVAYRGRATFWPELVLLGLPFYLLRVAHLMIERAKGTLPTAGWSTLLAYLWFPPTLLVGPINRFDEFCRESRRARWDRRQLSHGLQRLLHGLGKVVVLANFLLGVQLGQLLPLVANPGARAYTGCLQFGLSRYLLFSGHSDLAIGFAHLLGFRISENFNYPFLQKNISDFWRCWHISLSSWCRDYIYVPMLAWTRRPGLAAVVSLLVLGVWHELSWSYLLWGVVHGLAVAGWQAVEARRHRLPTIHGGLARLLLSGLGVLVTVHFVLLSFVLVRGPGLSAALGSYRAIFFGWW